MTHSFKPGDVVIWNGLGRKRVGVVGEPLALHPHKDPTKVTWRDCDYEGGVHLHPDPDPILAAFVAWAAGERMTDDLPRMGDVLKWSRRYVVLGVYPTNRPDRWRLDIGRPDGFRMTNYEWHLSNSSGERRVEPTEEELVYFAKTTLGDA
jgi:hypothetical protein